MCQFITFWMALKTINADICRKDLLFVCTVACVLECRELLCEISLCLVVKKATFYHDNDVYWSLYASGQVLVETFSILLAVQSSIMCKHAVMQFVSLYMVFNGLFVRCSDKMKFVLFKFEFKWMLHEWMLQL